MVNNELGCSSLGLLGLFLGGEVEVSLYCFFGAVTSDQIGVCFRSSGGMR